MLPIDRIVQPTHIVVGNLSRECIQRLTYLRMPGKRVLSNNGTASYGGK